MDQEEAKMGYDRYPRSTDPRRDHYGRRERSTYGTDYGSGGDYSYSSARDYSAAGYGRDDYGSDRDDYGRGGYRGDNYARSDNYGRESYGARDYYGGARRTTNDRGGNWQGSYAHDGHRFADYGRNRSAGDRPRGETGYDYDDRGFFARAGDEVRSWFGDDEAERRRELDQRYDDRYDSDPHYSSWRRERIGELDRDYDEYRRENSQKFRNEFASFRNERQGQRDSLKQVNEHMEVVGSDGTHVGTVDKVRGDRIILTKSDKDAGGHHHSIPSRWIQSVDDKVTIRKTADEAKREWRDEENNRAMFGDRDDTVGMRNLNRSFSGTY